MTFKNVTRISALLTLTVFFQILTALAQSEPTLAWAKRIGDNSTANIYAPVMNIDQQGNSYLAGVWLPHSYTMDGISLTAPISTIQDSPHGYIAKYDPDGQILWAKSMTRIMAFTEILNASYPNKLITDEEGNIYFCASGAVDAHSIINGYYLTDPNATLGIIGHQYNMFLAKLDADGNVLWVKKTAHPYNGVSESVGRFTNEIYLDSEGNINMTGGFRDSIQFSPGNILTTNAGETAVFLTKYSPAGDVLQTRKLEGGVYPGNQFETEHIRTDASGNLYRWSNRTGNNPKRLYRYDETGELLDSLTLTVSTTNQYQPELRGFTVSPSGDIFISGLFFGNLTLQGTTYNGSGSNNSDGVLFKLNAPNYGVGWVRLFTTSDNDRFNQLLTDGVGNVYALGTNATLSLNRMILQKYTDDGALLFNLPLGTGSDVTPASLCPSQNGGNIWVGGRYRGSANFGPGYQFTTPPGNHYNGFLVQYGVCNTANPVITTPLATTLCGQDSITLSANLSNPGLTYFWSTPNGTVAIGGSEITAELTVTQPGKYYLVAQEDAECYGKSQEIWVTQGNLPDNDVTEQNNTLTATEAAPGTTYQWLDCSNNHAPITGADAVSFTPAQNGSYAVVLISQNGCTDTSACYVISTAGLKEGGAKQEIIIYPNPAHQEITIHGDADIKSVRILDVQGKQVLTAANNKVDISTLTPGVYLVEILLTNNSSEKRKIVKE